MTGVGKLHRIPSAMYRLYDEALCIARNVEEIGDRLHPPATETRETLTDYLEAFVRLAQPRSAAPKLVAEISQRLQSGNFEEDAGGAPAR